MTFENAVSILNRLLENKISLKKAYYIVYGDNMERHILENLQIQANTGYTLSVRIEAALKNL